MSVRDIPEMQKKISKITCIDKVIFKYLPLKENLQRIQDYFLLHEEYTHLILNSDDGIPTNEIISMLLADVKKYDFPIISGCCCQDKLSNDMRLNVTVDEVITDVSQYYLLNYRHLPYRLAYKNEILKVWFQGCAACCIRRDTLKKVGLVYPENNGKIVWFQYGDLGFSYKCAKLGIPQYVDLRCYFDHFKYSQTEGVGKVLNHGEKNSEIVFVAATSKLLKVEPAPIVNRETGFEFDLNKKHHIFIGMPACNEEKTIGFSVNSIFSLDYPKDLLDVLIIENNSSDNTWESIKHLVEIAKSKYNFHSFRAIQMTAFYGNLPKVKDNGGMLAIPRAEHLCSILNKILDESIQYNSDFCLMFMSDVIAQPNIIEEYLKVFEYRYDTGVVGGVHHRRFPNHLWDPSKDPTYFGLESPTLKYNVGDSIPKDFKQGWLYTIERLNSPYFCNGKYPYSYGFRGITENEVISIKNKMSPFIPIIEVCSTGHILMFRKELFDLRYEVVPVESNLALETEMNKRGYKWYCHLGVYIIHISTDGKVYRHCLTGYPSIIPEGRQGPHP